MQIMFFVLHAAISSHSFQYDMKINVQNIENDLLLLLSRLDYQSGKADNRLRFTVSTLR